MLFGPNQLGTPRNTFPKALCRPDLTQGDFGSQVPGVSDRGCTMLWREPWAWLLGPGLCKHTVLTTFLEHLPILQMRKQRLGESTGACSRWRWPDQNPGPSTPAFAVPSFRVGRSLVQSIGTHCVSSSALAVLDTSSSCLTLGHRGCRHPHPCFLEH